MRREEDDDGLPSDFDPTASHEIAFPRLRANVDRGMEIQRLTSRVPRDRARGAASGLGRDERLEPDLGLSPSNST